MKIVHPLDAQQKESQETTTSSLDLLSSNYNAKDAIRQLVGLHSVEEVSQFISGDVRTTVLTRAKSRINAITAG